MRPPLRDYQQRAIQLLRRHHTERPILCLPTGAGKTSVASEVIRLAVARGARALFLVHRKELVDQAVSRLAQYDVAAGRILAGHRETRTLPVQVASIQSLDRRQHWPAELVLVDECAHAVSASWARVLDRYESATIIGLTATPCRLDGRGLGSVFGCILEPVSAKDLIQLGHLVQPIVYAPPFDPSALKTRGGEYDLPEVAYRMTKLTGSITGAWHRHCSGMRTVVFACTVDHSESIVGAFRDLGVSAAHIDYSTPAKQRDATLRALRDGSLTLLSQVQLLSEGWDLPSLQCVILARPTKSLALFRQMVGRVMRPPGPAYVLDHAGNHNSHGSATDDIEWSLDDKPKKAGLTEGVRTCPECFAVIPPDAETCPQCGSVLAPADRVIPSIHNPGELVLFQPRSTRDPIERYTELVIQANTSRYAIGWARNRFREEFKKWPRRVADIEAQHYTCPRHTPTPKPHRGLVCPTCLKVCSLAEFSTSSALGPNSAFGERTY